MTGSYSVQSSVARPTRNGGAGRGPAGAMAPPNF